MFQPGFFLQFFFGRMCAYIFVKFIKNQNFHLIKKIILCAAS